MSLPPTVYLLLHLSRLFTRSLCLPSSLFVLRLSPTFPPPPKLSVSRFSSDRFSLNPFLLSLSLSPSSLSSPPPLPISLPVQLSSSLSLTVVFLFSFFSAYPSVFVLSRYLTFFLSVPPLVCRNLPLSYGLPPGRRWSEKGRRGCTLPPARPTLSGRSEDLPDVD